MKKENYKIYMHKNKINGKVYIGQTSQSLNRRWNNGNGYSSCPYLCRAIEKYGWDNFEHILLNDNLSKEDADKFEKFYIQKYESYKPEYGYNISLGGSGLSGATKYKDIYKYTLDGYFIKHYKDIAEILEENPNYDSHIIRDVCDEKYSQAYNFQWRKYYKEKVENVKEHKANIGNTKIVYQYDLNGVFIQKYNDIKEASELTGFARSGISKACNGHQRVFEGYQWSFNYVEKMNPVDIYVICQYGIDGKLINIYNTPKEASLDTGITSSTITSCYNNKYDLGGGYIWKKCNISQENVDNIIEVQFKKIKLIALIDDNNNIVKVYHSAKEASEDLNFKDCSGIWNVCNGVYDKTHGYKFKYVSHYKSNLIYNN